MNNESNFNSGGWSKASRRDPNDADDPIRLEPDAEDDQAEKPDADEIQLDESDVIDESISRIDARAPKLVWTDQQAKLPTPEEQIKHDEYLIKPEAEDHTDSRDIPDSSPDHIATADLAPADYLAEAVEPGETSTSEIVVNHSADDEPQRNVESADNDRLAAETFSDQPDFDDSIRISEPDAVARPVEPNRPEALPLPEQDREEIQRKIERRRVQQMSMLDMLGLTTLVALTFAAARYVPLAIYMLLLGLVTLTMTFAINRNRKSRAFVLLAFAILIIFYVSAIIRFFWNG